MNKLKLLSTILLLLSLKLCVFSQDFCTTNSDIPDFLQSIPSDQYVSSRSTDYYVVRVFFHIIRRADGTGGQSLLEANKAFNILKSDYQYYGICFELLGIDEILNDNYYNGKIDFTCKNDISDCDGDGKFDNFHPNSHPDAIDIYLFANDKLNLGLAAGIPSSALVLGGTAYNMNIVTSYVISHEVGHCLGLYHTFHGLCESGCAELVNGSNCSICGDFVCDTPADPQIHNVDQNTCLWNNITCDISNKDANGDLYNPRTDLIMAYIAPNCMLHHTFGQIERMKAIIANSSILQNVIVPNTLALAGALKMYDDYYAVETITSTQDIIRGATYKAGSKIILKPGFHAQAGSNFHAYIYFCDRNYSLFNTEDEGILKQEDYQQFIIPDSPQKLLTQEVPQGRKIMIYPNPNPGTFQLETNFPLSAIGNLKITNLMGATVYETQNVASNTVQLQNPTAGTFFVIMILKDGAVLTRKMVVQ